jgi:hypothetical protein
MATNIKDLMESDISVKFQQDTTISLFGLKIGKYSLYANLFSIFLITIATIIMQKTYGMMFKNRALLILYGIFVSYLFFDIFIGEKKTGDLLYEEGELGRVKDNLLFMAGILVVILVFFNNISKYATHESVVLQILVATFLLNIFAVLDVSTIHKSAYVHTVRRVKESIYTLIIYLVVITFVYGFFAKVSTLSK